MQRFLPVLKYTMECISSTTGSEIQVEPFIIDLTSPHSTAPSTPTPEIDRFDVWSDHASEQASDTTAPSSPSASLNLNIPARNALHATEDEYLLVFFSSSPTCSRPSLFEVLVRDDSIAARAALLYYLPLSPVVQRDISTLVPLLLHDTEIMTSLATNIAYYHAHSFISPAELENLLTHMLLCSDPKPQKNTTKDDKIHQLYHFTKRQIEQYRAIVVPQAQSRAEQNHEKNLLKNATRWEKTSRRKRRVTREALPNKWHARIDVPLPYGCATQADVFVDVNEMYTLVGPPCVDWAQARVSTYCSMGLGRFTPRVVLPAEGVEERPMKTEMVALICEGDGFSQTRASFDIL